MKGRISLGILAIVIVAVCSTAAVLVAQRSKQGRQGRWHRNAR